MLMFYTSQIVADANSIELELHKTEEERRAYLVGWFNGHVDAGGLGHGVQALRADAAIPLAAEHIEHFIGRTVVLGEVYV